MGILKTKGLRPLVQNREVPFATKMPIRTIPFSKIGVWKETTKQNNRSSGTKNLIKHSYRQTDGQTDGRINEVRALPLEVGENKSPLAVD